jgi:hypothetical protein
LCLGALRQGGAPQAAPDFPGWGCHETIADGLCPRLLLNGGACPAYPFLLAAQGRVRYLLSGPPKWDEGETLEVIESLLAEWPARSKQREPKRLTPQ